MAQIPVWIPYCGEAPGPEVWLTRWNGDPVLGGALVLSGLALCRPGAGRPTEDRRRQVSLQIAWLLAVVLYVSPLCALSSAFFTVRVVHHLALVLLIAPLLARGFEPWLRRLPAPLAIATALQALVFWLWHAPTPYAAALSSVTIYALMQFSLLGTAVVFWAGIRRAAPAPALAAILATTVQMGLLGALIAFAAQPLYPPHLASTLAWGVAPLADQQAAGLVMWAPGSLAYLLAALAIGWRWLRSARPPGLHGSPA